MCAQIGNVGEYRADGDTGAEIDADLGGEIEGGSGDPSSLDHFGPSGEDSPPLPGDVVLAVPLDGLSETLVSAGYSDGTEKLAGPGEKRLYARDSDGAIVSEIFMEGDGAVTISQPGGASITLASSGEVTIDTTGNIKLVGATVALQAGTPLGEFLISLHTGVTAWIPVPQDGGAALKAALGAWLAKAPPAP